LQNEGGGGEKNNIFSVIYFIKCEKEQEWYDLNHANIYLEGRKMYL
jgi:hypothetical protein